jgi:hypothetical protein
MATERVIAYQPERTMRGGSLEGQRGGRKQRRESSQMRGGRARAGVRREAVR